MVTNKEKQVALDKEKWNESNKNRCDMSGKMKYCKFCKCVKENTCTATQAKREEQSLCAKADNRLQRQRNSQRKEV